MKGKCKVVLQAAWCLIAVTQVVTAGIACLSNPCFHGICIDDINSTYSCYCVDGYTGVQCQTNWDECWSAPCQNGGTCIDGIASYNCSCPDGFIGESCETNFNECESNPCANNGTCIDITNGYVCSCVPGFTGSHCEVDVAVCNSTEEIRCYNGGQCVEGPGFKFYCKCLPGWIGPKCEDQIDECQSNPCKNGGVCIDVHADYMCACSFGFTGKSCEVKVEFCDENSCSNNALCVVEDGVSVCYCVPDYHGERCEFQYDECLLGPKCMNGGTCIDGIDNFTCSCPPKLTGHLCECLILDDGTYDCEYISSTSLPISTQSDLLLTTLHEETSTTEAVPTTTLSTYNDTSITTIAISEKTSLFTITEMTTNEYVITTPAENITEPTTIENKFSTEVTVTEKTETETTTKLDTTPYEIEPITSTTQTKETIGSEDFKTETTTEYKEQTTEFTTNTAITTEFSKPDTTTLQSSSETTESTAESVQTSTTTDSTITMISAETSTTTKYDTTTDKIFTFTPTELHISDVPSPATYSTTESMEISTAFDNTTYIYTTPQSECIDSICNNHGTCINTLHGVRCHCIFNYIGKFCEDKISITSAAFGGNSYIAHKLRNTTSINVEFHAKTLITDGQLMHMDIADGVYMQLFMKSGLLKFKFSCGYQTMLLSELKTFVNKGYLMKIETRLDLYVTEQYCNATLRLNDTVAMSGGQMANISSLNHNSTLYLGNTPYIKDLDNRPFVGCIRDLIVNGEARKVFTDAFDAGEISECSSLSCLSGPCLNGGSCSDHGDGYTCSCANGWMNDNCNQSICDHNPCQSGGSCVRHPGSGFLCLCPYGRHGILCEYNVEITRPALAPISNGISSYLIYPLSATAMNSDRFEFRLRFHTTDMDQIALLAFVGQSGQHDSRSQHLALTFVKGYVMLTWNMGNGARRVFTARAVGTRRAGGGHAARVWRRGRSAGLSVDGRHNATGNAPAHQRNMTLLPYLYIGGHPSEGFRDLPHDLPLHNGWSGCIWDIAGQAIAGGKAVGGRGVGQCGVVQCTAKSCNAPKGVCIHSPATYGCICNEGWFGPTCSNKRSPCDRTLSKCQGRCVVTVDGAQCDCPYGKFSINCDQDLIPTDVLFTGVRSYAQLHPRAMSSISLSFEAEIKPSKERGLIFFVETPHFYTALSLQGGLLEYRWTDVASGVTSRVASGAVAAAGQWHSARAGRYGARLYVWVDGSLATAAVLATALPHTAANGTLLLGGAKDMAVLPFDIMSGPIEHFAGCMKNVYINNILIPLEQQNIMEGQNLGECNGRVCGAESCDACGGVRCRRRASCSAPTCAAPRGHCRHDVCVCTGGYTGPDCRQQINVTIPQFDGDSLLILGHQTKDPYISEQRMNTALVRPEFITLNFTTAELNELLLWSVMDMDYLGVGLENGYIKLVWMFHYSYTHESSNASKPQENSGFSSIIIENAGFLADGEWHVMVVRLRKTLLTVTVDQLLVAEETVLNNYNYEEVKLFIGGISDDYSATAKKIFPTNFKGCIYQISTNEESYVTNYTEVYSENIKSCQLPF